ncbi:MAG: tetratricopeptide repeat protein [Beggiatoa sp.]|nr:tetratricopeptide repeat protein [Beggiatoa sp.]
MTPAPEGRVSFKSTRALFARLGLLERAIRIEPRNPWLWHRLAVLRLQEGQHALAIELAKRSNVLARGNRRLLAGNWLVIGKARAALRDVEGAARARAQARAYLRRGRP